MEGKSSISRQQKPLNWATRVGASAVGAFCGLSGSEHGVGEILQGNKATSGFMIVAWDPPSALFGDEPAFTIVPDFLVTGLLAFFVSLMIVVWAIVFLQRKNGAVVLILLSITLFLVGGGIAPLFPAIIASVAATRISSPLTWWRTHLPARVRNFLAKLWPFSLVAFSVLFSSLLFYAFFYGENSDLILMVGYLMLGLIILTVPAGFAYDIQRRSAR